MSRPEIKKRHVPDVNTSTTKVPLNQLKAEARTVTRHEVSEWQLDNKYILSGYRREKADYLEIFTSLTFMHNETCNVYTHLVGALLLPLIATAFMRALPDPQFLNVSGTDYLMFGIYFWAAESCLVFSAAYHLMQPHSHAVEQFWHGMDLLGIVILTVGTFVSGIYYVFICEPSLQKVHWAIIITSGTATAVLTSKPTFRTLRWRKTRVGAYFALGASSLVPLLHGVQLYGLEYMLQYAGMRWYLLELALYGGGVGLYAFRIPERFAPGKFDIWGGSHQIFHVAILCAIYTHFIALMQAFTACHTLDLCAVISKVPQIADMTSKTCFGRACCNKCGFRIGRDKMEVARESHLHQPKSADGASSKNADPGCCSQTAARKAGTAGNSDRSGDDASMVRGGMSDKGEGAMMRFKAELGRLITVNEPTTVTRGP